MGFKIEECSAEESSDAAGLFTLKRTIYFEFTWDDDDATSNWVEDNVATDDAMLPSYVVGDYEGISLGEDMHDYETSYRGATT